MGTTRAGAVCVVLWALLGCADVGWADVGWADGGPTPADAEAPDLEGALYEIEVAELRPSIQQGSTLPIPVRVRRSPGFDAPVLLTAEGLPDMVYAEPTLEVPERAGAVILLEASAVATPIEGAPFTITGTAAGHRRSVRVVLAVTRGDVDW